MSVSGDIRGVCPHCGASVPERCVLIEYQRAGEYAVYAECPECTAVGHPV